MDEYVQWMLDNRFYDVEVSTGSVVNLRTNQPIKWIMGSDGYPYVELVFSQFVHRPIRVHRFVAIKAWGVEAVRGKHVAHLDKVRSHSFLSNLAVKTPKEHNLYDGNHQHAKESWPACCRCGDPNGKVKDKCRTPARYKGLQFGLAGEVCHHCYLALYRLRKSST